MATKHQELAGLDDRSSCLGRVSPDEPVLILRAQDRLMPMVARLWLELALFHGLPPGKKVELVQLVRDAEQWQRANFTIVKWPD